MLGFNAMQILHLDPSATEVHKETLHYIKTRNLTATFTNTKMFLINHILTFGVITAELTWLVNFLFKNFL